MSVRETRQAAAVVFCIVIVFTKLENAPLDCNEDQDENQVVPIDQA